MHVCPVLIIINLMMEIYAAPKLSKYVTALGVYNVKSFTYEINQDMHEHTHTHTRTHTHPPHTHTYTHTHTHTNTPPTHTHTRARSRALTHAHTHKHVVRNSY